jgi:hypothetical protein
MHMRLRMLPLIPVLATAALGLTANGASAATLFTNTAHSTRVTVGATASISSANWRWTSGTSGSTMETCNASTFSLTLVQNNDNKVIGAVNGASFTGCAPFPTLTPTFSGTSTTWTFTIDGTSTVSGTRTQWTAALHNFSFDFGNGNYRGNIANLTAWQPTASPSPVCIEFASAGSFVGPLTGDGRVDTTYCFEGAAAAWSLTN